MKCLYCGSPDSKCHCEASWRTERESVAALQAMARGAVSGEDLDAVTAQAFEDCEKMVVAMLEAMAEQEEGKAFGTLGFREARARALREAALAVSLGQHRMDLAYAAGRNSWLAEMSQTLGCAEEKP